jgi:hypothetical protein
VTLKIDIEVFSRMNPPKSPKMNLSSSEYRSPRCLDTFSPETQLVNMKANSPSRCLDPSELDCGDVRDVTRWRSLLGRSANLPLFFYANLATYYCRLDGKTAIFLRKYQYLNKIIARTWKMYLTWHDAVRCWMGRGNYNVNNTNFYVNELFSTSIIYLKMLIMQ